MQIQTLSFEQLVGAVAVILLMIGIYNTVMTALKNHREERTRKESPTRMLENKVNEHEEKLQRDHERLKVLEDGNRIMMRAMMAMLSHEINGNSTDALKKSMDEIHAYLIDK